MRKIITPIALVFTLSSFAVAQDSVTSGIVSAQCGDLADGNSLSITVSSALTSSATITVGTTTGITGTISGSTISTSSTVDCGDSLAVVDGSTTYDFTAN